jgi:hypothetical protein
MATIRRETIIDRRQPALRWSAVIGGAFVAIAAWLVLQLLGIGGSLLATNGASFRSIGVAAGIWMIATPIIALWLGGMAAGRLAATLDRRLATMHGLVMWALTEVGGLLAFSRLARHANFEAHISGGPGGPYPDVGAMTGDQLRELAGGAGTLVLGLGISMLLGLGAAVLGATMAARGLARRSEELATERAGMVVVEEEH